MPPSATPPDTPLLRHRAFRRFWVARAASGLGFQMLGVAVGWQIYALTGSAFALGLTGLAQFVPMAVLTLAAGHAADRHDRARIARTCQAAEAALALLLAAGSLGGWLAPWSIYTILAAIGAARAFEGPGMTALLPGLVPPEVFPRAAAWSASANQTANILGPALGGVLALAGFAVPYGTAALLFLAASLSAACIRAPRAAAPGRARDLRSVFSGITFIRTRPVLLGSLTLDLFAVLLGGATALLPVYARDILHTGPWGLGLLRCAPAVGALLMSVALARHPMRRRVGRRMFAAVVVFGAATIGFALSRTLPLSLVLLAVLGAADVVSVVVRHSLVQMRTPDEMRGRVSAAFSLFVGTSNQLGEFESGATAALFGTVPAVVLGGAGTIAVALAWMGLFPDLREVETLDGPVSPAPPPSPVPATPSPGPAATPGAAGASTRSS